MNYRSIRTNKAIIFCFFCLAFVANGILSVLPSSSLTILAIDTHVALSTAGLVFTVTALGSIIPVFISTLLVKKVGTKNMILTGLGGLILASILIPTTGSFNIWLIAQLIDGMSSGLITVGLSMALTFNFKEALGEKMNILYGSAGLGSLLAPLMLANTLSLTGKIFPAFLLVSMVSGLSVVFLVLALFADRPEESMEVRNEQFSSEQSVSLPATNLFKNPVIWFTALQILFYVGTESGFSNWLVTAISQGSHIALVSATPAATLFWVGLTVGRMVIAQVMKRNLITETHALYLSFSGGGISSLCVILSIQQPLICFAASLFLGTFLGPIFPSLQTIATRRFEQSAAFISSIVLFSTGLAGMTVPMSIGLAIPHIGVRDGLLIPAAMGLSICIPFYLANRKAQKIAYQESVQTIYACVLPAYKDITDMPTIALACELVAA
jgi:fucose permease